MTVRETSALAYQSVMDSGYIGKKQKEVYAGLFRHQNSTGSELYSALGWNRNPSHSNIGTRLGELRDMGVVDELPKRRCKITGHLAIEWQTNDAHPRKPTQTTKIKCPTCKGKGHLEQGRLL